MSNYLVTRVVISTIILHFSTFSFSNTYFTADLNANAEISAETSPFVTIFIGGAGFNGKEKNSKKNRNFTQNFIFLHKDILDDNDYLTAKKSVRFLGIIRNSVYTMKYGHEEVEKNKLKKFKHKALKKTIKEIRDFYKEQADTEPINIVGSSYGSVVAAQVAIQLIKEHGLTIKTLTLSASSVSLDPAQSDLGKLLLEYESSGHIGNIIWHPNPDDDITGASGKITIWKLIFQGFSRNKKSILSPKHPHNLASKNTSRTKEIIQTTLIEKNSEQDTIVQQRAKTILLNQEHQNN